MRRVDCCDGIQRNVGVVGRRQAREPLCVAQLDGNDVLQDAADRHRTGDVAVQRQQFGMLLQ